MCFVSHFPAEVCLSWLHCTYLPSTQHSKKATSEHPSPWASINDFLQINNWPGALPAAWDVLFEANVLDTYTAYLISAGTSLCKMKHAATHAAEPTEQAVFSSPKQISQCGCMISVCIIIHYIPNKLYLFALKVFDRVSLSAFRNILTEGKEKEKESALPWQDSALTPEYIIPVQINWFQHSEIYRYSRYFPLPTTQQQWKRKKKANKSFCFAEMKDSY